MGEITAGSLNPAEAAALEPPRKYEITLHHDASGKSVNHFEAKSDSAARVEAERLLGDAGYGWRAVVWAEHMGFNAQHSADGWHWSDGSRVAS